MHWFAILFTALRRRFSDWRAVPAGSALDNVPPEALWQLRSR